MEKQTARSEAAITSLPSEILRGQPGTSTAPLSSSTLSEDEKMDEPQLPIPETVAEVSYTDTSCKPPRQGRFPLAPYARIRVGRAPNINDLVFADLPVSRHQLEFFTIYIDQDHCPMVYVRDRQSSNGTYVNGRLIGRSPDISPAWLLENNDIVEALPHLTFTLHQSFERSPCLALTAHQRQELELIKDRFVLTDRSIGEGSHAIVHVGIDVKTGTQVVCKVQDLRTGANARKEGLERLRQEALLMNHFSHPYILGFKQAFETQNTLYLFMDFATGGDLFSLMMKKERFSEFEIRIILRQVLRAVEHLHAQGVVHRDIKMENILCAIAPTVSHRFILGDLGHAGLTSRGRMKSNVGTTMYRAPETRIPDGAHSKPVDIWAIGILTLQLLAGIVPVAHSLEPDRPEERAERLRCYLLSDLPKIRGEDVSEEAQAFVNDCLILDGSLRRTASQALNHQWLQEPTEDRMGFEEIEGQALASWASSFLVLPPIVKLDDNLMSEASHAVEDNRGGPTHSKRLTGNSSIDFSDEL